MCCVSVAAHAKLAPYSWGACGDAGGVVPAIMCPSRLLKRRILPVHESPGVCRFRPILDGCAAGAEAVRVRPLTFAPLLVAALRADAGCA